MKTTTPAENPTSQIIFQVVWGPDDALAAGDFSRLSTASAEVSDELVAWLRAGSAVDLDQQRADFLIESFLRSLRDTGWNPHESSEPLKFRLLFLGELVEVIVRGQPQ